MTKDEFITLIKVTEGITKIDQACKMLTGTGMDDGVCNDVYLLWDLLRKNSSEQFQTDTNLTQDIGNYHSFSDVLENETLTAEQKYDILTSNKGYDNDGK